MIAGKSVMEVVEMMKYRGATRYACSKGEMVAEMGGEYVTFEQYKAVADEMRKAKSELDDLKQKAQQLFGLKPVYIERDTSCSWRD